MNDGVLVVGGAGYIGSHMVKLLLDRGCRVVVFDNLSRGHEDAVGRAQFIRGDVVDPESIRAGVREARCGLVMHFAALCYVGESVTAPDLYYRNNVVGSLNLLAAMRDADVGKIVFSSSCATYGLPVAYPITEEHPQAPVNPYGWTKLMVEQALRDYAHAFGIRSVSLRYFNAAGCDVEGRLGERHSPETHLIPRALLEGKRVLQGADPAESELVIHGTDYETPDGTCIRDYVHVQDIARAHWLAGQRLVDEKVSGAEAYNLGNGTGYSVREVIDECRRATGAEIRAREGERRPGDPGRLVGSSEKAARVLGWRPEIPALGTIIESAWNWFRRSADQAL